MSIDTSKRVVAEAAIARGATIVNDVSSTLAACAGGLICGFLWEFWNYWAVAKWVYKLPFLGATLRYHYFEMPVVGLLGFIPFGMECWVMWQTLRIPLDGMVEPLPDEASLL